MDLTRAEDVRTALKLAGIRPNKGLGQHFLVDKPSLEAIMDAAAVTKADTVLEIGPGLGVMTRPLTELAGQVVAVETDRVLAEILTRDAPDNLQVVLEDILTFDVSSLPAGYKAIANIPYYLTSKIFRLLIESPNPPSCHVGLNSKRSRRAHCGQTRPTLHPGLIGTVLRPPRDRAHRGTPQILAGSGG